MTRRPRTRSWSTATAWSPMPEFEARQIVIAHEGLWAALEQWGAACNLMLVLKRL